MKTLLLSTLVLTAFGFAAMADEPMSLTDKEMDIVTAGAQEFVLFLPEPAAKHVAEHNPNAIAVGTTTADPGSPRFVDFVHNTGLGRCQTCLSDLSIGRAWVGTITRTARSNGVCPWPI